MKKILFAVAAAFLLASCQDANMPSPSQCAAFIQTDKDLTSGYAKTDAETTAMFHKYAQICRGVR